MVLLNSFISAQSLSSDSSIPTSYLILSLRVYSTFNNSLNCLFGANSFFMLTPVKSSSNVVYCPSNLSGTRLPIMM